MKYDPNIHRRRSIRLRGHDYSRAGVYFVTICTHRRECFFGNVIDGEMRLDDVGLIARSAWAELLVRFPGVRLDEYVIMPNHIHGIIILAGAQRTVTKDTDVMGQGVMNHAPTPGKTAPRVGAQFIAPKGATPMKQGVMNHAPTLAEIVRAFKAATTRRIRLSGMCSFRWQRNYYEHIIRDEKSLARLREYVINNPLQWHLDELNPDYPLPAHEERNVQSRQ